MLSFRDFHKSMTDRIENYRTTVNGANRTGQGHVDKDGYPCVVVHHGGHSKPLKPKKDKPGKKVVKEAVDTDWHHFNDNHHLGNTTNQVHWNLTKHYGDRTEEHTDALKKYTSASTLLNSTLYDDHVQGRKSPNEISVGFGNHGGKKHNLEHIDAALTHKPLHENLHVYSGVHFDVGDIASRHPDRHVHLPAYTSASIDKSVARDFAHRNKDAIDQYRGTVEHGHILHIALPKGHHGSYVGLDSHYENEKEFLVPRHTTLHVHPDPTEHEDTHGRKFKIWHATPVDHKPL